MENWRAGLFGVGIVLIGLGGYSSLEGVWKGLSLVAAGIALVLLGLSLERRPRAGRPEGSSTDVGATVPMAAVAVEVAEPTAPIVRTEPGPASQPEVPEVPEGVPSPRSGPTEQDGAPANGTVEAGAAPIEEGAQDQDDVAHEHGLPMLGHSELVSHIRDYHESVPFDGSTIQLRLLHERAHT